MSQKRIFAVKQRGDRMDDTISRQAALKALRPIMRKSDYYYEIQKAIQDIPSAQPQYEELTPEEAASEITSGSIMSIRYWLDAMIRLKQMGYAICRKR